MGGCNCGGPPARPVSADAVAGPAEQVPAGILNMAKLGRCRFCIYSSLVIAIAAWGTFALLFHADPNNTGWFALMLLVIAFLSTLLFMAHMGVIALRKIEHDEPLFHRAKNKEVGLSGLKPKVDTARITQ